MNITRKEKINRMLKELENPDNWQPNYSKISKKTGIAVSTIHMRVKNMQHKGMVEFSPNVKVFHEIRELKTAFRKWKERIEYKHNASLMQSTMRL